MAGEVREPQKLLPRAVLLGTGGVLLLYLALNVVYALALSADDVGAIVKEHGFRAVEPIAQIAAERLFGTRWSDPLSIAIGLMLLSSLSAYLLIGPRVLFAMAQAGQFPSVAARLTPRANTPAVATLFQIVLALVLLWVGTLRSIIEYAGHRPLDLLDAGHGLDLCPAPGSGPTCPGHSGRPGIRSRRRCTSADGLRDARRVLPDPRGLLVCAPEHPGRCPGLLRLAVPEPIEAGRDRSAG